MFTVQATISLPSLSSQDQFCNGILGLIPASQAWFTGSFGEVFELSNILFSLICYLPKGSLRGSNVFFLSICDVFALIHLYSLTHIFVIYFKKRVKKRSKFLWVYNYQMCILPICIVFFPQYPF